MERYSREAFIGWLFGRTKYRKEIGFLLQKCFEELKKALKLANRWVSDSSIFDGLTRRVEEETRNFEKVSWRNKNSSWQIKPISSYKSKDILPVAVLKLQNSENTFKFNWEKVSQKVAATKSIFKFIQ
jgi:hypothetical protein